MVRAHARQSGRIGQKANKATLASSLVNLPFPTQFAAGPLAQITESAGQTRRALIEHRAGAQGAVVGDGVLE